jgi:host factor-I protein
MSENQDREQGVQNDFFNEARKNRTRLSIFLTNGKRLAGRIKSFDRFAIVLDAGGGVEEMVFKHAIATISVAPHRAGPPEGSGYRAQRPAGAEARPAGAQAAPATPPGPQGTALPAAPVTAGSPDPSRPSE